jgi:hypothetical protein
MARESRLRLRARSRLAAAVLVVGCAAPEPGSAPPPVGADDGAETGPAPADASVRDDGAPAPEAMAGEDAEAPGPPGAGLFAEGCPQPGRSTARRLSGGEDRLTGPASLGGPGDAVLYNDRAAFVIQAPADEAPVRSYWYYGGGLVDAAPIADCAQAAPEKFGEIALLVARLDLRAFPESVLRGFRADRSEILNDGADGEPARLRMHGVDDRFWLVEHELVRRVVAGGRRKALSAPFGVEVTVDYILPPDTAVLTIETRVVNRTNEVLVLQTAAALFLADETLNYGFTRGRLGLGGLNLGLQVPFLVAESPDTAYALALESAQQGTTNISGVDVLVDVTQAGAGALRLAPGGGEATRRLLVSVGGRGAHSAVAPLVTALGLPTVPASVRVVDASTGAPLPGRRVRAEARPDDGVFAPFDAARTDADGRATFDLWAPDGLEHRFVVPAEGLGPDLVAEAATGGGPALARVPPPATLAVHADDGAGHPLPVRLTLSGEEGSRYEIPVFGGEVRVAPGRYDLAVTRGWEHAPWRETVELAAGDVRAIRAALPRIVDTTGAVSLDTHVHAAPSPDSRVALIDRALDAAGVGLEVMISTDHEVVADWTPGIDAAGVGAFVRTFAGQEVTATTPEHLTMYPVAVDASARRGGFIPWYGQGLGELFAALRARGAPIRGLNHPRGGCNWLCLIGWDRLAGAPTLTDPTVFGLPADQSVWSWDFEQVEYMNGHAPVFANPERPESTGLFEDWTSFLNHGHRITAVGVTDAHDRADLGSPRTYVESPTDDPAAFTAEALVEAIRGGRAQVSAGAFARVAIGAARPGDLATVVDGLAPLSVRIEALPEVDVTHVTVFANCDAVAQVAASDPEGVVKLDTTLELPLAADAYVVVLAFGSRRAGLGLPDFDPAGVPRATTNPIYVDVDGDGRFTAPGGKACRSTFDGPLTP